MADELCAGGTCGTIDFRAPAFLRAHIAAILAFYRGAECDPRGGMFHGYRDDGSVYDPRTRHLVSSARFVFNHAMAWRHFGDAYHRDAMRHALGFLQRAHRGADGRYAWELDWDGCRAAVRDPAQRSYGLAFVLLAHAHARLAGEADADPDAVFETLQMRFWEPRHGLYADEADDAWRIGPYRGQNANMHVCEAMLAAFDATGSFRYVQHALRLADAVVRGLGAQCGGLVWEHYRSDWSADWDYNRGHREDLFRPWGVQTGHLTEWAKLLLQLEQRLPPDQRPPWLLQRAKSLFAAAMRHGWDERHGGLIYGFAPDGSAYDTDKHFWVHAESFAAAAALAVRTGDPAYWDWYTRIWQVAWRNLVDHRHGGWYRVRSADFAPLDDRKSPPGKTDYHTMGACYEVLHWLGQEPSPRTPWTRAAPEPGGGEDRSAPGAATV